MNAVEKVARVLSAVNALKGVPGAKVEVKPESEKECAELAALLDGVVSSHATIFPADMRVVVIYSFSATREGVGISGQNTRPATRAEKMTAGVWDPQPTTAEQRAAALAKLKPEAKRDEFSCPCCGTPTDSSYCGDCTEAECGEQDVGTPHKCLVGICQTCGGKKNERHTLNVCADGHESPPRDDHDLRADMRREDLGGWHP